ncbi:hypothetical protein [Paeniglutamicibacter sp. NPDC091659]
MTGSARIADLAGQRTQISAGFTVLPSPDTTCTYERDEEPFAREADLDAI